MEKDNENENFVFMEIQIWNTKDSNGLFPYKNNYSYSFKKVFFKFHKKEKSCYLIKTKDNYIQALKNLNDLFDNEILFKICFRNNNYKVINPLCRVTNISCYYNDYLDDKIWFPVKSANYFEGNIHNYILNINDIIKLGRKKYIVTKMHFEFDNGKDNIIDENFYKNNNISYISLINKKSKSIFNYDLKTNQYKIRNDKKFDNKQIIEELVNELKKEEFKNINQNNNNNISNNISNQNNDKNPKNNNQISPQKLSKESIYNKIMKENESNDCEIENDNENDECWICLNSNCDENNPLISLCNCHNFIHYECLKMYLYSNMIITENSKKTVTTYTYKKFNCNICLKPYKLRFRIPELDKTYELIDLSLPEKTDYFCLESLDYIKDNNNIKTIHIVQLTDEEISIGRNDSNDIIVFDISVSREHAVLKYNKNNRSLFLENKNGRYGTLVLVRRNIKINEEKTFFQISNTHISMELSNEKNFEK